MTSLREARIGDEVVTKNKNYGKIVDIKYSDFFPVHIRFYNTGNVRQYTFSGKLYYDEMTYFDIEKNITEEKRTLLLEQLFNEFQEESNQ